ncbi:MAG TPA: hypothetical protein EYO31_07650 [Phycisphaerales bacterium]|nr:hypothetical protein [Phycisphaerales bacterium]
MIQKLKLQLSLCYVITLFACGFSHYASAEYIQVTEIGGSLWDPWLDTQLGDPVTVQYVFDSNAPDHSGSQNSGLYPFLNLTFAIGDIVQTALSGAIWVDNDISYWGDDQYSVIFGFGSELTGAFSFSGFDMFSSDALSTDLDWTQYATSHVGMIGFDSDNDHFIRYQFSSWNVTVVPGAPTFLALLFGVSYRRRRQ